MRRFIVVVVATTTSSLILNYKLATGVICTAKQICLPLFSVSFSSAVF